MPDRSNRLPASEYGGEERLETGLHDLPADQLDNGDRLRLGYLTEDDQDPTLPIDRGHFLGVSPLED